VKYEKNVLKCLQKNEEIEKYFDVMLELHNHLNREQVIVIIRILLTEGYHLAYSIQC